MAEDPKSRRPSTSASLHRSDEPVQMSHKKVRRTDVTPGSGGSALKAQLDSVRYPAGRRGQRRRVVTTQLVGTPRKAVGHRRDSTASGNSSSSSPTKKPRAEGPSQQPQPPPPSPSLLRKADAVALTKTNRPKTAFSSSPLRRAESVKATRPNAGSKVESTAPSPERTPSKLKLRKSHLAAAGRGKSPGKTPATSPAGGRGKLEVLGVADNK